MANGPYRGPLTPESARGRGTLRSFNDGIVCSSQTHNDLGYLSVTETHERLRPLHSFYMYSSLQNGHWWGDERGSLPSDSVKTFGGIVRAVKSPADV